jgi:vanillate O-demethylase ferredoxin subunit
MNMHPVNQLNSVALRGSIDMRVTAIIYAGPGVNLYEVRPISGDPVPPFDAGAHVDLYLSNGLVRQYSIASDPQDRDRYVLGIKFDTLGRGGSRFVHESVRAGTVIPISMPRSTFSLVEDGKRAVFIAGGIGVTPFLSMAQRASRIGMDWKLYVAVRTRADLAVLSAIQNQGGRVATHVDEAHGNRPIDLAGIVRSVSPDTHLYCCGPSPMLKVFEQETSSRESRYNHIERFSNDLPAATAAGYTVQLARSNLTVKVEAGQTIIDALRREGIDVTTSCEQGVCGSCETKIVAGRPDHRDVILTDDEKASNRTMMICCSGSLDDVLVLDL